MQKPRKISQLRHRVQLCSQKDIVVQGNMFFTREGVTEVWAEVLAKNPQVFGLGGDAINEREKRSHTIRIRYRTDIAVTSYAWLYEKRLKSPPRWFKVLKVTETEESGSQFYIFDVRLVERSDEALPPTSSGPAKGIPDGVSF